MPATRSPDEAGRPDCGFEDQGLKDPRTKDSRAMQPDQAGAVGNETPRSPSHLDRLAVRSRRRALDRLWASFRGGLSAPVLITGEPGAGKSWLVRRFAEGLDAGWRSAEVEMTSAL